MTEFKPQHLPSLDGLRGIAILMVLWFHTFLYGAPITNGLIAKLASVASVGQTGVDLFFVLSGFLITRILLASKNKSNFFINFYARRLLRIFPLYYGFLIIYFLVLPIWDGERLDATQWWFWTYLQNVALTFEFPASGPNHFWSLAVEEHFYLFWPLVVYRFNDRQLYRVVGLLILVSIFSRAILMHFHWGTFYFTLCRVDGLAMGAYLALLERSNRLSQKRRGFSAVLFLLGVVLGVLYLFLGGKAVAWIQLLKSSFIALAFTCTIGLILTLPLEHRIHKFLQLPFLTFTGKISYGLYVLQGIGFYLARRLGFYEHSFLLTLIGMLLINYIVAYTSYRFYETPFLKLKTRFA